MDSANEISLDGFKVVSGDYFVHLSKSTSPTLTVWDGSICFSKQNILLLNKCENVLMQINAADKRVVVFPTKSTDKDALKWIKKLDPLEARRITCPRLTDMLYDMWKWDKDYIYRTEGKLVTSNNKVMMYFNFQAPESWKRPEAKNVK